MRAPPHYDWEDFWFSVWFSGTMVGLLPMMNFAAWSIPREVMASPYSAFFWGARFVSFVVTVGALGIIQWEIRRSVRFVARSLQRAEGE